MRGQRLKAVKKALAESDWDFARSLELERAENWGALSDLREFRAALSKLREAVGQIKELEAAAKVPG